MSVNNFENNVQQKLDELRLRPTEQVWLEVERRIREKKRRRVIFWFLLPGILLLGGGTWLMLNQFGEKNEIAAIKTIEKSEIHSKEQTENKEVEKPVTLNQETPVEIENSNDLKPKLTTAKEEKNKKINNTESTIQPVQLINKEASKLTATRSGKEIQKTDFVIQKPSQNKNANTNLDNPVKPEEDIIKTKEKISKPYCLTCNARSKD